MRFDNRTNQTSIDLAIQYALNLLNPNSKMILELTNKNDFKFNSGTGQEVVAKLLEMREPIKIFTYKPMNPWTKAIGYFDGESIHINLRKLPSMTAKDVVANLLHEYSHYCGFTHGNNFYTTEKSKFSVPYFISDNIGKWL